MIRTHSVFCATRIIRDADLNRLSAIDIFEEINAPGFPIIIPRLAIAWILERDAGDDQQPAGLLRLFIGDQQLQEFPVRIDFEQVLRARAIINIGGIAIERPGVFRIALFLGGNEVASYRIAINSIPSVEVERAGQAAQVMHVAM